MVKTIFLLLITLLSSISNANQKEPQSDMTMRSTISKSKIFINQPFFVKTQLSTTKDLQNIRFSDLNLPNTITKLVGTYKVYDSTINGKPVKIVELEYIVTPLKSGKLSIPIQTATGNYVITQQSIINPFSTFSSSSKPIAPQENNTENIPFSINSKPVVINIQDVQDNIKPWLPAELITLTKQWNSEQFVVGEPYKLTITVTSKGLFHHQLPKITTESLKGEGYKIYLDNSDVKTDTNNSEINSSKQETYTIIPQKSGKLSIPEIKIPWWDVNKNMKSYAILHVENFEVLPNQPNTDLDTTVKTQPQSLHKIQTQEQKIIILGILVICILFVIPLTHKKKIISKNLNLSKAASIKGILSFWQRYGTLEYQTPHYASMKQIFDKIILRHEHELTNAKPLIEEFITNVNNMIYGSKNEENHSQFLMIKKQALKVYALVKKCKKSPRKCNKSKLPELNPVD